MKTIEEPLEQKNQKEKIISQTDERKLITGFFNSSKGVEKIYYKRSIPLKKNKELARFPHLIFLHDIGDYHGRYMEVGEKLIELLGNSVVISWLDIKGHGLSSGTRVHIEDFEELIQDFDTFLNLEIEDFELMNILVGQGLGALIGVRYFQEDFHSHIDLEGMILASLPVKLNLELPDWIINFLKGIKSNISHVRLPLKLDGFQLTHDIELAKKYNTDPLIHQNIPVSTIREIMNASSHIRTAGYFINIPTLFLVGEKDKLINTEKVRLFYKGAPKNLCQFRKYPNSGHDIFNDLDRDKIYLDLYNWIKAYFLEPEGDMK